ncbi:MAG TPA: hypothetical protein VFH77_02365, partial [Streptomyces sp.]|nr:hypothetical protein [Streptomyces sp.]
MTVIFTSDGNDCQHRWMFGTGRTAPARNPGDHTANGFGSGPSPAGSLRYSVVVDEESTVAADKIDTIVSLSKRRGFVYPCSEIYGGQRAAWD